MAVFLPIVVVLATLSPGLSASREKTFVERAGTAYSTRPYSSVLTVSNGEQFGNWTWPEMCPDTFYAVGFSLRVEPNQYALDDTSLNGIRLICAKAEDRSFLYTIESHTGYYGDWSSPQYCPRGTLISFQLRVEPHQGMFGDDTAVNNIKFRCSSNPVLEGTGNEWGEYGTWSQECGNGGICGIETKMEEYQYGLDDSSLNDVRLLCCSQSQK
ncbi:vitelline membrane outer layer protein 1-like [Osmerus mordax]|uniref:Vitelline membrane outer layer protein 1 homolog n=1 Tax=Osmerus mordax TaxID=8014 RepID=C1BKY1_OSMMO|nr:Vitelline membrane outer layer protein 1 homolog precursor [Osmerus mordax]